MPAMTSDSQPLSQRLARLLGGAVDLPPDLAAAIDRDASAVKAAAGRVMFDAGSPCRGMLLLERGQLRVARVAPDGRELLLYHVGPGDSCVLTVSCLLGGEHYPARGTVVQEATGVFVPAPLFSRLTHAAPAFRDVVFRAFAERITSLVELAAAVRFDSLDRRLASRLLDDVERSGRIEIQTTHAGLAADLGSAREQVSRLLERFAACGAVELGRGRIVVRDKGRLQAIAAAGDSGVV